VKICTIIRHDAGKVLPECNFFASYSFTALQSLLFVLHRIQLMNKVLRYFRRVCYTTIRVATLICLYTSFSHPVLQAQGTAQGTGIGQGNPQALPKIGKITGKILNKITSEPVEFATVAAFRGRDTVPTSGAITNKQGLFTIDKLPPGRYRLRVRFIGFLPTTIDSVLITPKTPEHSFERITIEPNAAAFKDVEVTAEKQAVQYAVDRKIYNVSTDLTVTGGLATDVLQNIPSITVDADQTVSLRGSSDVTILIDGRPSTLTLAQIPADNIERVEVITNPSARFDADGAAGIINIILKKNIQAGYNGTVTLSAGTGDKYTAAANVNVRLDKTNIFVDYNFQSNTFWSFGTSDLKNMLSARTSFIDQRNDGQSKRETHSIRAGVDYSLDDFNTLTISGTYAPRVNPETRFLSYAFLNEQRQMQSTQTRDNRTTENGYNGEANVFYRMNFVNPQQVLTADVRYSQGSVVNTLDALQTFSTGEPLSYQIVNNPLNTRILRAQADYEHPFANGMKLETGIKFSTRQIDNNFQSESASGTPPEFKNDVNLTNHLIFSEQVYGGYATVSGAIEGLSYSAGARLEQTDYVANQRTTNQQISGQYLSLFPSAALRYKLPDDHELGAGYSRRINRPSPEQLNPFPQYTDPFNLQVGNPLVQPEFINSYELSWLKYFEKSSLNATLYYRHTDGAISRFRDVQPDGVTRTTFANYNRMDAVGLELVGQAELLKWWRVTGAVNVLYNQIDATNLQAGLTNRIWGGNARVSSTMRLWEGIDLQVAYFGFVPSGLVQGFIRPIHGMDVAVKKDFFDDKLSVSLRVSDALDTRQFNVVTEGLGFAQELLRKRESRIAFLSASWRFGGDLEQRRPQRRKNEEREQSGGEDGF